LTLAFLDFRYNRFAALNPIGQELWSLTMAARKENAIRVLRVKKGESDKSIYARLRKAFTAADLQKYTEIEEGIPAEQLLAELEAIDRETKVKPKRKAKHGRSR
jgi:hypothetical protein